MNETDKQFKIKRLEKQEDVWRDLMRHRETLSITTIGAQFALVVLLLEKNSSEFIQWLALTGSTAASIFILLQLRQIWRCSLFLRASNRILSDPHLTDHWVQLPPAGRKKGWREENIRCPKETDVFERFGNSNEIKDALKNVYHKAPGLFVAIFIASAITTLTVVVKVWPTLKAALQATKAYLFC